MLRRFGLQTALALTAAILLSAPLLAGELDVNWNPSAGATGYVVYYGTSPDDYPLDTDVGNTTSTNIDGLEDCRTWYFAASAYNAAGGSGVSNEDSGWPRPVTDGIAPASGLQGESISLTLTGVNYQAGTGVSFSSAGIAVQSVTVNSCNQMVVAVVIDPAAPVGPVTVEVANASDVMGSAAGLFTVQADGGDTTPPVISAVSASGVTASSATIDWSTDEPADGQVFYREAGVGAYLQTSLDTTLRTDHGVTLNGLSPDTDYQFHVASADDAGNGSQSNDFSFTTATSPYSYLSFEAEAGVLSAPVRTTSGADAFGGAWIDTPSGLPNGTEEDPQGTATYGVNLPDNGTWHVWIRIHGENSSSDSWFVSLDDGPRLRVVPPERRVWVWTAGPTYVADAGLHDLELGGREAQTRADRILLTDDPNFVPSEEPGGDVVATGPVGNFSAVPQGNDALLLAWTNPSDGDYAQTVIRFRTDGRHPVSPFDGFGVVQRAGAPGSSDSVLHDNRQSGVTYAYSAFAIDASGNVAAAAHATGSTGGGLEPPDPPQNLRISDASWMQTGPPADGAVAQPVGPNRRRRREEEAASWRRIGELA